MHKETPKLEKTTVKRSTLSGHATWESSQCWWSPTTTNTLTQKKSLSPVSRHSSSSLIRARSDIREDLITRHLACQRITWTPTALISFKTKKGLRIMSLPKSRTRSCSTLLASWPSSVHSTTFWWSTKTSDSSGLHEHSSPQYSLAELHLKERMVW